MRNHCMMPLQDALHHPASPDVVPDWVSQELNKVKSSIARVEISSFARSLYPVLAHYLAHHASNLNVPSSSSTITALRASDDLERDPRNDADDDSISFTGEDEDEENSTLQTPSAVFHLGIGAAHIRHNGSRVIIIHIERDSKSGMEEHLSLLLYAHEILTLQSLANEALKWQQLRAKPEKAAVGQYPLYTLKEDCWEMIGSPLQKPNNGTDITDFPTAAATSFTGRRVAERRDVDALFNADRESINKSEVTFSGLLNAIDGLVSADNILTVMTTNHIERLDPALLRAGRVDRRFHFPPPDHQQIKSLFLCYYPEASEHLADNFATAVFESSELEVRSIAMLQEHFILTRTKSANECYEALPMRSSSRKDEWRFSFCPLPSSGEHRRMRFSPGELLTVK
eukprot:IDg2127t1